MSEPLDQQKELELQVTVLKNNIDDIYTQLKNAQEARNSINRTLSNILKIIEEHTKKDRWI